MRSSGERTAYGRTSIYRDSASVESIRGGSLTLAPIIIHMLTGILVECLALWGERERSRRQYRSQASVFKPALFTEHSNTDKMKKRRTVADSVANIGESEDRDRCLGTSVAYLGVNTRP